MYSPVNVRSLMIYLMLFILFFIAAIDKKSQTIPNELVTLCACLSVVYVFFLNDKTVLEHILGIFCDSGIMIVINIFVPNSFGGGDIKLMAVMGFFLGAKLCINAFFIAVFGAGVYAVLLFIKGRKKETFAFGPFLCIAITAVLLIEEQLLWMHC